AEQAIAFLLFSVAAAGTPGPSNVLLTATGAQVGVLRGLPCLFGVALGMALMMFVVAFGLGSVILGNPLVLRGIKWAGAAVLLWLALGVGPAGGAGGAAGAQAGGFLRAGGLSGVHPEALLPPAPPPPPPPPPPHAPPPPPPP